MEKEFPLDILLQPEV